MLNKSPIPTEILTPTLMQAFGSKAGVEDFASLGGGARKKVFRLKLTHPLPDIVLLIWQNDQDYFNERDNPDSPRSDQQAPFLFKANTELLLQNGLRVPKIYHFDGTCERVPFAFALVEYINGHTYHEWQKDHPSQETQTILLKIREFLKQMHAIQRDTYGTLLNSTPKPVPCYEDSLPEIRSNLQVLSEAIPEVAEAESRVNTKLDELVLQIRPRVPYQFIHDELGSDEHLLIEKSGEITIIDLDGCHFFDVEREFSYLKIRFGPDYKTLDREDLDDARMAFYTLCIRISAAYGHYQLYQKGFPDAAMLRSIYESNIRIFLEISMDGTLAGYR